jgi:hypothetical protein
MLSIKKKLIFVKIKVVYFFLVLKSSLMASKTLKIVFLRWVEKLSIAIKMSWQLESLETWIN